MNNLISKPGVHNTNDTRVVHIPLKIHNKLKLHVAKKAIKGIKTSLGVEVANALNSYLDSNEIK